MYQQVLGEYFGKDGKCHMVNTYEKEEVIYCQKEVIDNMGDISFVIGNAVVKFAFKKLFNCVGNEYNSLFNLDYDFYGDDRTIDTHIKMLRNNLGEYRNLIITVRGIGYKYEEK
jgi:hypothetical protein